MGRVTPLCGGTDKGVHPRSLPTPAPSQVSATDPSWPQARCSRLRRVRGNACLHCGEVGRLKAQASVRVSLPWVWTGSPAQLWQEECRKPPEVKAVGDVLLGCDQLNLHEISTPVLSSQAAATWDPSLVSQLLYLLFHDTNLLLDPDRKPESAGCLKAKCY